MNRFYSILALVVMLVVSDFSYAKRTYGMRPKVYEQVQQIQLLLDQEQWQQAIEAVDTLQNRQLTAYEMAQTWDIRGLASYQQDNLAQAINDYEKVLMAKEDIPEGMYWRSVRTLSQLNMMDERYAAALNYAIKLLQHQPVADTFILIAQAQYRLKRHKDALGSIKQAKQLMAAADSKPRENWLLLENAIYHANEDYTGMLGVLEELLKWYPKDDYLLYTANVYGQLDQTGKQTALLETLYEFGSLSTSSELKNLSSLYLMHNVPYKSAVLLSKAIEDKRVAGDEQAYELLASAWRAAGEDEKAVSALANKAVLSKDSEDYLRLAYQQYDLAKWEDAIVSLKAALRKEDLEDTGNALVLLGMAELNLKKFNDAQRTFLRAARYDTTRKLAKQWLTYSEREADKYAQLDSSDRQRLMLSHR